MIVSLAPWLGKLSVRRWRLPRSPAANCFVFALCCLALCGTFLTQAGAAEDDTEAVKSFKNFLAHPPCVKEIRFTMVQKPPAPQFSYAGGMCGADFFLRPCAPGLNALLPVSYTNPPPLGWFVGTRGEKRWTIAALTITEATFPTSPTNALDPHTANVKVGSDMMRTLLALGPHYLEPGTFVWSGNRFVAATTDLVRRSSIGLTNFSGEIVVSNGMVAEMVLLPPYPARYRYAYASSGTLPPGIPSKIIFGMSEEKFTQKFLIEKFELAEKIQDASYFEPYWHVDSNQAGITILTNGGSSSSVVRDNTRAVLAAVAATRPFTSSPLFFISLAALAIGLPVCIWAFVAFRKE